MTLKAKLGLMFGGFAVFVAVSALLAFSCIRLYLDAAFGQFQVSVDSALYLERVIALVEEQAALLESLPPSQDQLKSFEDNRTELSTLFVAVSQRVAPRSAELANVEEILRGIDHAAQQVIQLADQRDLEEASRVVRDELQAKLAPRLREQMAPLRLQLDAQTTAALDRSVRIQHRVATILAANVLAAIALGLLGLLAVRRWIVRPITSLQQATGQIAAGDLNYRMRVRTADEFGVLSRQVNEMAASLTEAQSQLVRQERAAAVAEMVSTIAHNIRNPLAGIRAAAQSTLRELPAQSSLASLQRSTIEAIDSFDKWLRGLLYVAQPIELQRQRVEIATLIEQVAAVFRPSAERRHVKIDLAHGDRTVYADVDPRSFEQALAAVVDNAVEASPTGGTVRIEAAARLRDGTRLTVCVSDEGPGVPEELREKVFEPHFTTRPGSSGIGLPTARKLIEAHGGRLELLDGTSGGTLVRIELPSGAHNTGEV